MGLDGNTHNAESNGKERENDMEARTAQGFIGDWVVCGGIWQVYVGVL